MAWGQPPQGVVQSRRSAEAAGTSAGGPWRAGATSHRRARRVLLQAWLNATRRTQASGWS
jgi:hypothetical protein